MHQITIIEIAEFPALSQLRFSEQEFAALRTQGFVSAERRRQKLVYKLRFRLDGRQQVCFLGDDEHQARAVQDELLVLRRDVQEKRRFAALRRRTWKVLRESKTASQRWIEECGYHFHGLAIRKRRGPRIQG